MISAGLFFICLLIPVQACFTQVSSDSYAEAVVGESESSNRIKNQLDKLFEYCKKNSKFSGSVLIAHHGSVVFKKSFGLADQENNIPVTSTTSFNVASTTKPFTAMAVAKLAEIKKLNFDDYVQKHLAEFPYQFITLRHLLTHTSGLPDYAHRPAFIKYHNFELSDTSEARLLMNRDVLDWLIESEPELNFKAGDKMSYCNTGYIILAMIIEKLSGQTFSSFVEENILIPADMSNSAFYSSRSKKAILNRAFGYSPTLDRASFELNDMNSMDGGIIGDGGLYASVEDLYKLDRALYTELLLTSKTIKELFIPAVLNDGQKKGYGLGWILAGYDGPKPFIAKHGGKWRGFTTAFQRLVDDSSVVIILANCGFSGPTIGSIRDAATDILLGKTPKLPKFPIVDKIAGVLFKVSADSAIQLYQYLAENENENYFFDEQQLNVFGYRLMYANRLEDAKKILKANVSAYPGSSNVYDSLGDIYRAAGDTLKAVEQYKKALLIDPEQDYTKRKLTELAGSEEK
jgi:CubicO group peptidase (beta-lactamase class C family)